MREYPYRFCFLLIILAVNWAVPVRVSAQSNSDLTAAEQWVLKQTFAGEVADLEIQFSSEKDRVLSAAFLERLLLKQFEDLTPSENSTRYRIHIEHATFIEPLKLEQIEVQYEVWLGNCQFKNTVDLSESYFYKDLTFNGSNFDEDVDFYELYVGKDLGLENAQFKNSKRIYNFRSMKVGNFVFARKAVFAGPVDFRFADIGNNFEANEAQFNYDGTQDEDGEQIVNKFGSMKVGNFVFINQAVFSGPVDFRYVEVGNNFEASGTQFNYDGALPNDGDERLSNYFASMKVGHSILLNSIHLPNGDDIKVIFAGPVDFRYVEVGNNFEANDAQFNNIEQIAYFGNMKIAYKVLLNRAVFEGPVNFEDLDVGNTFEAIDTKFNSTKTAYFRHMKIGGAGLLNGATFEGPVDFRYTEVETNFEATDAQFKDTDQDVNFNHIRVGDTILLKRTFFAGRVLLTNSEYGIFHMEDVIWPSKSKVDIDGMTYKSIVVLRGGDKAAWQELIWLVNQSPYNAQTYKTLESFFENQGYPERADQVYIEYKKRERKETLNLWPLMQLNWRSIYWWWWEFPSLLLHWGWNWFLFLFIRYGRSPGWAIFWSLALICLGAIVFWKKDGMIENSKLEKTISVNRGTHGTLGRKATHIPSEARRYNAFWYSLDLFIGPVDLGFASRWEPKPNRKVAFIYSRFQLLSGWILIPIALLTLTGVIK